MLHTNLGTAAALMESLLRGEACPLYRTRLAREWELLSAANLLPQHAVLRETAAFLRHCRIPFLMGTPLGLTLALFHRTGITAASPLLFGFDPDHVLPFAHSIRPWTFLVSSRDQDRLGDILHKLGIPVRGRHSARLDARIFPGFSGRLTTPGGSLLTGGEGIACRFRFSRLLGLVSLFEETTGYSPDALTVQESVLEAAACRFPEALEALSPREVRRLSSNPPADFSAYLAVFASREKQAAAGEPDDALRRHCAGMLEASRGRFLFREELVDILRRTGAIPATGLAPLCQGLLSGGSTPADRETFLAGAVDNGLARRDAARIWNSLVRHAPLLVPLAGKKTASRLLLWRALVLQQRDRRGFAALRRSERLL